jgi:hypothetical protein
VLGALIQEPRRRSPVLWVVGAVVVVGIAAGAWMLFGRGKGAAQPSARQPTAPATPPPAAAAPVAAAAESVAAASAEGFIRISGDLPDDAEIYLDTTLVTGLLLRTTPGRHRLEIQTGEFQPWERTLTVRAGDTLRVSVELELLPDTTQS